MNTKNRENWGSLMYLENFNLFGEHHQQICQNFIENKNEAGMSDK